MTQRAWNLGSLFSRPHSDGGFQNSDQGRQNRGPAQVSGSARPGPSRSPAARPPQPYSPTTLDRHSRSRGATVVDSVCCYCAVGCGIQVHVKDRQVVNIEGNPHSPINEGTLCPKGANIFQLQINPHRVQRVMWRAPYSDRWEFKTLDWALDRIAHKIKEARDSGYLAKTPDGRYFNAVKSIGCLGGATLDIEENYLIKKLFGAGLQVLSIENQARI